MAAKTEKATRGPAGRRLARGVRAGDAAASPAGSGEDYTAASGRDHPAQSEHDHAAESVHDHARQKLNGESAKMVKRAAEGADADKTAPPRKA
jgi:hypothetical protein